MTEIPMPVYLRFLDGWWSSPVEASSDVVSRCASAAAKRVPACLSLSSRHVLQDLPVRGPGRLLATVAGIERQAEPLTLSNGHGVEVSLSRNVSGDGPFPCAGIRKQQEVRYVLVAGRTLLRKVVSPTEKSQHMLGQVVVCEQLSGQVGSLHSAKAVRLGFR